MAPEHESAFGLQEPIWQIWSVEWHSKSAELHLVGLWPNGLRVTIMHTLFDLFAKGCVQIQNLIVRTYFLESSNLYKQRLNLIIQHFWLHSKRHTFQALKSPIFSNPFSGCCCLNQDFQVSKRIEQISLNPKKSSQEQSVLMQKVVSFTLFLVM